MFLLIVTQTRDTECKNQQEHLHNNLVVEDVSSGLTAVDKGNVELYLKVIAQITTLYKAETSTMLFGGNIDVLSLLCSSTQI